MRIRTDTDPPIWVQRTLIALTFPIWGPLIGLTLAGDYLRDLKRYHFGPYVIIWQAWFAWHPVHLDGGWGDLVWLETVERKALGSSYNSGIVYQLQDSERSP